MRILYGVQGTGNGHISRARELAKYFAIKNVCVDYLFTGRDQNSFFDMEIFGNYHYRRGLTFYNENGQVNYLKTFQNNNYLQFLADIFHFDLEPYDLIITDFEPVSAWAARLSGKKVIGIGHQYAFGYNIPLSAENFISKSVLRYFAPANISIGLHWDKFRSPILPPIIDTSLVMARRDEAPNRKVKNVLVYLPFEDQEFVQEVLATLQEYIFTIYSPDLNDHQKGNLILRKASHDMFKSDLIKTDAVICGSGFELISECLHLGLPILTKPQGGQMEQQSNAMALQELKYATVIKELNPHKIESWCNRVVENNIQIKLPNVAAYIVNWVCKNHREGIDDMSDELWNRTSYL